MRKSFALLLLLPLAALADIVVPADKVENSVNIRLEPDATSDVVGELHKGTSLPHVRSIEGWHEVELEGEATGYVSADWSRVEPDPPQAEVEEADADGVDAVSAEVAAEAVEAAVEDVVPEPGAASPNPLEPEPAAGPRSSRREPTARAGCRRSVEPDARTRA